MNKTLINNYLDFCGWLSKNHKPIMGFDTETTSLSYLDMSCIGFSLATDTETCYVRFDGQIPSAPSDYFRLLEGVTLVMHNSVFDLKVLHKYGFEPEKIFCTLVGAKLCDENLQHYGLKDLAVDWLRIPASEVKKYEEVCADVHSPKFFDYATNDAIWTYQLYLYEMEILKREGLVYLAEQIEMAFQFVLRDMEINGVFVDKKRLEDFKNVCRDILFTIESDMLGVFNKNHTVEKDLWGQSHFSSPINFGSTKQLVVYISSLGFTVDEKTKKGNPSVGKIYLQKMKGKHLFFDLLYRYRKLLKLYNGFIEPADAFIDSDGRIRPSYNMVTTGRLSCSDPNLQQLPNPKKEKLEFNYREIFVPKPGHLFVKADYSGQELRNLAEVSHDKTMVDAFSRNFDLHLVTANRIFSLGLTNDSLTDGTSAHTKAGLTYKTQRHQAKNGVNFPVIYGAFSQRIAADNHVSIEEAQRWLDEFDALYPHVKQWKLTVNRRLAKQGYVTTLMGRRRRFPLYNSSGRREKAKMERQAANFEIQGFSADQMKIAAVKVRQYQDKYRARLVMSVHDELVWELPCEQAKEFSCMVKYTMEHCVALSVPVIVDLSVVSNYGE